MNKEKVLNLANIKNHPIKVTSSMLFSVLIAFVVIGKPYAKEELAKTFFTQVQASEHTTKITNKLSSLEAAQQETNTAITKLSNSFDTQNAFNMLRNLQADLERCLANPRDTNNWRQDKLRLEKQVALAHDYKNCVLAKRDNCQLIQQQIVQ